MRLVSSTHHPEPEGTNSERDPFPAQTCATFVSPGTVETKSGIAMDYIKVSPAFDLEDLSVTLSVAYPDVQKLKVRGRRK